MFPRSPLGFLGAFLVSFAAAASKSPAASSLRRGRRGIRSWEGSFLCSLQLGGCEGGKERSTTLFFFPGFSSRGGLALQDLRRALETAPGSQAERESESAAPTLPPSCSGLSDLAASQLGKGFWGGKKEKKRLEGSWKVVLGGRARLIHRPLSTPEGIPAGKRAGEPGSPSQVILGSLGSAWLLPRAINPPEHLPFLPPSPERALPARSLHGIKALAWRKDRIKLLSSPSSFAKQQIFLPASKGIIFSIVPRETLAGARLPPPGLVSWRIGS